MNNLRKRPESTKCRKNNRRKIIFEREITLFVTAVGDSPAHISISDPSKKNYDRSKFLHNMTNRSLRNERISIDRVLHKFVHER